MKRQIIVILASSLLLMITGSLEAVAQEEPTLQGQGIPEHELPGPSIQELSSGAKALKLKLWKAVMNKVTDAIDTEVAESKLNKTLKNLTKLQIGIMTTQMTSPVRRGQHPKDHACVAADFTIEEGIPSDLKQGVFKPRESYDAVIRFSNARSKNDTATNVQGMAIKLFGIPGDKILKDEMSADTQDFLLADDPAFFAKDPSQVLLLLTKLVEKAKGNEDPFNHPDLEKIKEVLTKTANGVGLKAHLSLDPRPTFDNPATPHSWPFPLTNQYWSQTPYQLKGSSTDYVKYFARPSTSTDKPKWIREHFRREEILARLEKGPIEFDFFIQRYVNESDTPLNDPTVPWTPENSPLIKVATIKIHQQDFNSLNARKHCENLSFTPWHALPTHEPYGEINLARKYVYLGSSLFRHAANGAPRVEPSGQELLAFKAEDNNDHWLPQSPQYPRTLHECAPIRESEPYKGKEVLWLDQWLVPKDTPDKRKLINQMRRDFYHRAQGTEIIPYSWFLHLEQFFREKPFRSEDNLCRYKVIPDPRYDEDAAYGDNPDGLPVGFVRTVDDRHPIIQNWLGFTCAACHTGQIDFGPKRILIDGGQSMWDIKWFVKDMLKALGATLKNQEKFTRFAKNVFLTEEAFTEEKKLKAAGKTEEMIRRCIDENLPKWEQLFAKDRIKIEAQLKANVVAFLGDKFFEARADDENGIFPLEWGFGRLDALGRGPNTVLRKFHSGNVRVANAPVNFPKLWDAWRYTWVQWNASVSQPLGRNIAEAIGVGARVTPLLINNTTGLPMPSPDSKPCMKEYNWDTGKGTIDPIKCTPLIGTSINLKNLNDLEGYVRKLKSPEWPKEVFGPIDETLRAAGEKLYNGEGERGREVYCARCHYQKPQESYLLENFPLYESPIHEIGTDATNTYNFYARRVDAPLFGWKDRPADDAVADLTTLITQTLCLNLKKSEWHDDQVYCEEKMQEMTQGRKNIWRNPLIYMAGTNWGVWATAPYLHNGSVPNLYQLLSPREERSVKFCVGNLEFDPKHVGYVLSEAPCAAFDEFEFDTNKIGNANTGHEFRNDALGNGVIGRWLAPKERLAIIEYLKTLNSPQDPG